MKRGVPAAVLALAQRADRFPGQPQPPAQRADRPGVDAPAGGQRGGGDRTIPAPAQRPAAEQHRAEVAGGIHRLQERAGPRHPGRLGDLVAQRRDNGGQQHRLRPGGPRGGGDAVAQPVDQRPGDAQQPGQRAGSGARAAAVLTAGLREDRAQVAGQGGEGQPGPGELAGEGRVRGHRDLVARVAQAHAETRVRRHVAHRAGGHDQHPHAGIMTWDSVATDAVRDAGRAE
ncbi:hypothetical protein GCM10012284_60090 [Mangrovihabitans endophyticus]|uniref:Uncharacterized protein n=1 Tax=Mangrovihabitans endophyticus TaxID=1751298 RepID=A0A8J3FRN0_9ACTN|nr:hypothetical protein GCM10012284_60090 [Mangrovihabitans endophyticus]